MKSNFNVEDRQRSYFWHRFEDLAEWRWYLAGR